ncbi:methyltransferase domain-containing protein [Candidatus Pseudothioglobus singularis]|jgi:ubiquinone/menaquinone biosynthesis C-methylase UbiE|nr:methyltransferase domain-containing protein [Candidatus Pseudothioglobus singularis]
MNPIFKKNVNERIRSASRLVIEIGCGSSPKVENAITLDFIDSENIDIVTDINEGIPFEDNSVDEIHSYHFLEHVEDLNFLLKEMNRVIKEDGLIIGTVPHFSNPYYFSDPTHKIFFGLYTFSYFDMEQKLFKRKVPTYYSSELFIVKKIRLGFTSPFPGRYIFKKMLGFFVNISRYSKEFYEENLVYIFPAYEIYFELRKAKK